MQVVSAGVHVLSPGQKVTIYKENQVLAGVNKGVVATKSGVTDVAPASVAPVPASAASAK
jgi:hypothetical protein